jgi:ATP/maltotriose-dependent transcriptional regulator MalT
LKVMPMPVDLERGREAFARGAWADAFATLSAADKVTPLGGEDLERLAVTAFLLARDSVNEELLARAHHDYLNQDKAERAARCAFWLGFGLLHRGQRAQASGWFARARRVLDDGRRDCVELGYLRLPEALRLVADSQFAPACATFGEAVAVGERFGDADLVALARMGRGRTLIALGNIAEGIALLDEVMVGVTSGEVSAPVIGTVYCSVIETCHEMFDLRRAHEWTTALAAWCESQPDIVPYRGHCLVRRAEILQLHGEWPDAMEQAVQACETLSHPPDHPTRGAAFYQRAELLRLRGEFADAEEAYRIAAQASRKPLPGLALLRLAQGQTDLAVAAVARLLDEARDHRTRPRVLAASVEISLAAHNINAAREAVDELKAIAGEFKSPFLGAIAQQAEGAVLLADGNARAALEPLRLAWAGWNDLGATYEVARVRTLIGSACRQLGDADAAMIEWDAARDTFERLGAMPDVERLQRLAAAREDAASTAAGPLTAREVEVLRLLATGTTNRAIADALAISEKTVARHVSNIFTKLDLPSRAAATAYAYQHGLVAVK